MKINVLGTDYEILFEEKNKMIEGQKYPGDDYDGYIDFTTKRIYIADMKEHEWEEVNIHRIKTIHHEIVHAFLYESGLDASAGWARNEEIVDWIALQAPKLFKAFESLEDEKPDFYIDKLGTKHPIQK